MWDLGNRSVVALVSVLSGCVFLYNVWGPILILTISLFLTIYACYSLIVNDSLLSPHAFLLFDYCRHSSLEVYTTVKRIVNHVYEYIRRFWKILSDRFRVRQLTQFKMDRRRGTHYQLSDDSYPTRRNSSSFTTIAQLSPIPNDGQKNDISNNIGSKEKFYRNSGHSSYNHSPLGKHILMPMFPRNKEELENQTFESLSPNRSLSKKVSPMYKQNHTLTREDSTYLTTEGSLWDASVSPKIDANAGELKAGQTIGGPLLSSTRYNMDQRVYNDVTSPGLTTRLTKYAAEANSKLAHQSQYRVGQFPKVNLHASPVPLINAKSVRSKTPVTVRVAPPHTVRYSPPSRQKIFTNPYLSDNSCSSPTVAQTLREISLKRHASREDVVSDLAKKQRTEDMMTIEFETQDETKQKRSREDSLKSEEDASPQSKADRPSKRTKTPSCYDIINSLSSSKHVVSGVKRKARDFSRSGTPDFEKHFKSLESIQNTSSHSLPQVQNVSPKYPNDDVWEKKNTAVSSSTSADKIQEQSPLRGILKTANKHIEIDSGCKRVYPKHLNAHNRKDRSEEAVASTDTGKLTHKLFMRAEPERNEKLRMLVEEQGNIRAKFTTDDVEEIKKEDIADMRQTSMKARLQSMFDAISGKAASQINPDVVIQAEEVNAVKPVAEYPVTCATLNSSTTTTNVNTTPISTSAVVPSLGANESYANATKHVAFNLPDKEISSNANTQNGNVFEAQTKNVTASTINKTNGASENIFTTTSPIVAQPPVSTTNVISTTVQNFDFAKSSSNTVTSASSDTLFKLGGVSSNNSAPLLATPTTSGLFGNVPSNPPKSSPVSTTSSTINAQVEPIQSFPKSVLQTTQNVSSNSSVPLGGSGAMSVASTFASITPPSTTSVTLSKEQTTGSMSVTSNPNAAPSSSGTNTAPAASNITKFAPSSAPLLMFGNKTGGLQTPSQPFSFGSAGNSSQSTGTFGSLTNSLQAQTTSTSTSANTNTNTSTKMHGTAAQSNSVSSSTSIDSSAKTTAATFTSPASSTFSFRAPTSSESSNKPGFSFGNMSNGTKTSTVSSSTAAFSTVNTNALPSFGSLPTSSVSQFASNTPSIFGNASSASIFGSTTASQPAFGTTATTNATNTTFAASKACPTPMFGSNAAPTSVGFAAIGSPPAFSNTTSGSSSGATNTTAVPVFGSAASTSAPSVTQTSSSLFSGASSTGAPPTFAATSNIFGQTTSSSANFKSTTGVFGSNTNNNTTTTTATTSNSSGAAPNLFGSPAITTSVFGTTNAVSNSNTNVPVFGSTNSSGNAPVPTFGTTNIVTPVFGSQNTTSSATPGTSTATFGTGSSIFGSNSATGAPVFGANATSPFGSSAPSSFGGQNASSSSAFGAPSNVNATSNPTVNTNANTSINANANSVGAFGDNKALPFGAQTPTFGSSNPPNTAFGTATNTTTSGNNNTSGMFSFGTNQKPSQQSTAFSFGSSNNNNNNSVNNNATTSTSVPFQFGGTPSNPATNAGFNFSAPTTTPSINFGTTNAPTFNASTPGMFNIGTGFTAPRSRNVRNRKPR